MNKTIRQVLFTTIPIVLLLAACAPAPAPTPDPNQVNSQVSTAVALTVASQNLDTAQAQPPATETPLPTATVPVSRYPDCRGAPGYAHRDRASHFHFLRRGQHHGRWWNDVQYRVLL